MQNINRVHFSKTWNNNNKGKSIKEIRNWGNRKKLNGSSNIYYFWKDFYYSIEILILFDQKNFSYSITEYGVILLSAVYFGICLANKINVGA